MVQACDEAGVHLFVVKQNRSNATLQLLKRAVTEGRFGRIALVTVNVFWCRPQSYYDSAPWRGTWEFDGGAFMNQASHYVDLLDWLIGPVESVQAYTGTLAPQHRGRGHRRAGGPLALGRAGHGQRDDADLPENLEGSVTVLGERGTVRVGGIAVNGSSIGISTQPHPEDDDQEPASYDTTSVYGLGHPLLLRNVIEVLRGGPTPDTDGREGLHSLETLIATYLSARDGRRVSLPLE